MIKINAVKALVNEKGLKFAKASVIPELIRIASQAVDLACKEAGNIGSPKLEGRHFKGIKPYRDVITLDKSLAKAKKSLSGKKGRGRV